MVGQHVGLALAPVVGACFVAGLAASVGQVGLKPTPQAIKPDFKKLNPMSGFKQMFSPQHLAFETAKNLLKTAIVGRDRGARAVRRLDELAALVGMPPQALIPEIASMVMSIAQRAAIAYIAIAIVDYVYQRYRFDKNLKMDKEEVKQEFKQQELPAEIRVSAEAQGDGARPRTNDGRSSHRRRDRHEPHPLLRRSQVREREFGTHRGRQGCRQPRVQDP